MEESSFWSLFPVLDIKLWTRVRSRLTKPSALFLKRMGMLTDEEPLSLDNFFEVKGLYSEDGQLVEWLPLHCFTKKNLHSVFDHVCEFCNASDIRCNTVEGTRVCARCGSVLSESMDAVSILSDHHGPSTAIAMGNVEKTRRVNTYMYKRCNHFKFWISRIQAKETTGVKPGVVEAVRLELQKERIEVGDARITYDKVRSMLKKLRLQKYYNNTWFITSVLSGRRPPELTALQEEKLVSMFHQVQEPFNRHCPKDRVNMMSYAYLLRKMAESLGWYEFAAFFPLLKSRQKVYNQDLIWKKICDDVGFKFVKSIS